MQDLDGRIYDSRKGFRGYYRYAPRKLAELCHMRLSSQPGDEVEIEAPKIHETVFARKNRDIHPYSPISIPAVYDIVTSDGEICRDKYETPERAAERARVQERIWDLVWQRSVLNVVIMTVLVCVVAYPVFYTFSPEAMWSSPLRPIADLIILVGGFLPDSLSVLNVWINAYASKPGLFCAFMVAVFALYRLNSAVKAKIADEMFDIWRGKGGRYRPGLIYFLRTSPIYLRLKEITIKYIWPNIFAVMFGFILLWFVAATTNRVLLAFEDAAGMICRETGRASRIGESHVEDEPATVTIDVQSTVPTVLKPPAVPDSPVLNAWDVCQSMGVELVEGKK
jgi:hypothetical protein